jgi:hypothetical protein
MGSSGSSTLPNAAVPPAGGFRTGLAADVAQWLSVCQRTTKALRVYERNNAMIQQFADKLGPALERVTSQQAEITLVVREDRFLFAGEDVLVNADRQEGMPFIFYRNAFRRLTIERGMDVDEQLALLSAVAGDLGSAEVSNEDLLSALWRLELKHLRYFTIDAMSIGARRTGGAARSEAVEAADLGPSTRPTSSATRRSRATISRRSRTSSSPARTSPTSHSTCSPRARSRRSTPPSSRRRAATSSTTPPRPCSSASRTCCSIWCSPRPAPRGCPSCSRSCSRCSTR